MEPSSEPVVVIFPQLEEYRAATSQKPQREVPVICRISSHCREIEGQARGVERLCAYRQKDFQLKKADLDSMVHRGQLQGTAIHEVTCKGLTI